MIEGGLTIFAEDLPAQCPPTDAKDVEWIEVYRLLDGPSLAPPAFASHAAKGKPCRPDVDPCRWASCSLVLDVKPMKKLPKFKKCKWAVRISIPEGAGKSKKTSGNHIDFWPYADFVPAATSHTIVSI
ncbi:hypothetical protein [Brevundimonas sp. LPMIX5]|uniref:hypothetical protein n=1 Tax=Brevundimonas sp. LPMIX5 TaxID=2305887 RepID=UPI0011C37044|nr:hypothetical protein [Brevundimonas sp. LPMIX5]